ncbi:MAG: glycine cleavage system aminomethyltransferase GcvT [Clostridiales bacterium]|nr:glycine cleavage system aminomethyltransferase GcvT [Clostridiales bacterium]
MSTETLRTPLYEEHIALGARMAQFAGFSMPVQYSGIIEEHGAVRSCAGVFDVCHMAQFRVFGFDAFDLLSELLTNDLSAISALGAAQYTLVCDEDGGIIDDVIVYHTGDLEYLIIANAANRKTVYDWLVSHRDAKHGGDGQAREGMVEIADESDRTGLIALQGPRALDVLAQVASDGFELPPRFHIAEARLESLPVLVARTGYTGEDGVEIVCHASHAAALWRVLLSFPEVTPCGLGARDVLRLEMGYHLYGSDMDRGVDPISAGLGWTVGRKKERFIGKEAIDRIRAEGPSRKLVGLVVNGGIPRPGYGVLRSGVEVGKVASGTYSPTLATGIATAYLPVSHGNPGTEVEVAIRGRVVGAVVVRPPFVKHTSLSLP